MRKRALKDFAGSAGYGSFTIRVGVSVSPFYGHLECVCAVCCVRERETKCKYVCQCLCVHYNIFPFIGDCGVCGKMSVAHFHTPIVFQWACRCGGYSPWLRFHHIIHGRCLGMETDCCVGLCEGQSGSSCGFFIFHLSIQWGTVLPYLGHHGGKKAAWYCSQDNTSLNHQRHTGHLLPSDLRLLLNDELKTPEQY